MILQTLKEKIWYTPVYNFLQGLQYWHWKLKGRPIPPPNVVKQLAVKEYGSRFEIRKFVETGTFHGDMISAVLKCFNSITSIELDHELFSMSKHKFAKFKHVKLIEGDSSKTITQVLSLLKEPALFWLDAHYSVSYSARADKDTPINEELQKVFSHSVKNHVILIDDARLFNGTNDYPTLDSLCAMVKQMRPDLSIEIRDDIIRIIPQI